MRHITLGVALLGACCLQAHTAVVHAMMRPAINPAWIDDVVLHPPEAASIQALDVRAWCVGVEVLTCDVEANWTLMPGPDIGSGVAVTGQIRHGDFVVDTVLCCPEGASCVSCMSGQDDGRQGGSAAVRFETDLRPGTSLRLSLRGRLQPRPERPGGGWAVSAVRARHVELAGEEEPPGFRLWFGTTGAEPMDRPVTAWVQLPEEWQVRGMLPDEPWGLWHRTREGVEAIAPAGSVELVASGPESGWTHGGPIFGFGSRVDDAEAFRARFGWELAFPDWLLGGIALESDFARHLLVVPSLEAASPYLLLLPSFGLGLGAPIDIRVDTGETRVGARVQLTVAFPYISLFVPFDFYPELPSSHQDFFQVGVYGQVSL